MNDRTKPSNDRIGNINLWITHSNGSKIYQPIFGTWNLIGSTIAHICVLNHKTFPISFTEQLSEYIERNDGLGFGLG